MLGSCFDDYQPRLICKNLWRMHDHGGVGEWARQVHVALSLVIMCLLRWRMKR